MEEVSYALGHATGAIMWDLEKFYDSINWEYMVKWALETKFDPTILLVGLSMHTAPRRIRVGPFVGEAMDVNTSVVAGCGLAVKWSKIMLYHTLQQTHHQVPKALTDSFYGDMVTRARGSPSAVFTALVDAATLLAKLLAGAGLKCSVEKSTITTSDPKLTTLLQKELKKRGVPLKVGRACADLGVDSGAGARRSTVTSTARITKACRHLKRIAT